MKTKREPRLLDAAVGAAMLVAAVGPVIAADQVNGSNVRAGTDTVAVKRAPRPAPPSAQSAAARHAAASNSAQGNTTKPWSIEDALPDNSRAVQPALPDAKKTELGRMPLRSSGGSIGIETDPQFKSNEFAGGNHTPTGLDTTRKQPQYLGLSLSLPTAGKSIVPSGVSPPWAPPE